MAKSFENSITHYKSLIGMSKTHLINQSKIAHFKIKKQINKILNQPECSFAICLEDENRGFFSLLISYIDLFEYYSKFGIVPNIYILNQNYRNGEFDILDGLFKLPNRTPLSDCDFRIRVGHTMELYRFKSLTKNVDNKLAAEIVRKELVPNEYIKVNVEEFINVNIGGEFIAIHWRGTDQIETTGVSYNQILDELSNYFYYTSIKTRCVYIATDEISKLKILTEKISVAFPEIKIVFAPVTRSHDGQPIHRHNAQNVRKESKLAEEALFDCLVLARSNYLIRTTSNLSAWSSIFNPNLKTKVLDEHIPELDYYEWRWLHPARD